MTIDFAIDVAQAEDEVGMTFFQVLKHFLMILQADGIGDVKFVHQQSDQIDTITLGFALIV